MINIDMLHCTDILNLSSILDKGLVPGYRRNSGQDWVSKYHGTGVYGISLYDTPNIDDEALDRMYMCGEPFEVANVISAPIVIICNIWVLCKDLVPDEESPYPTGMDAYQDKDSIVILKAIPSTCIRKIYLPNHNLVTKYIKDNNIDMSKLKYLNMQGV